MAKNWKDIPSKLSAKKLADINQRVRNEVLRMELRDLRDARDVSQAAIAEALDTGQPSISRLESADDMLLSTLRNYVESLGGQLEIHARFDDMNVALEVANMNDS